MYMMGIPVTVTVDEFLPFSYAGEKGLVYGSASPDSAMWMPILEKAAAKLYGNYEMLSGGWMGPAVQSLTGAPYFDMRHSDYGIDELWQNIKEKLDKNWMVTSASHVGTGSDQDQDKNGIAYRHAYTIVAAAELEDGTKLLRVRNPWGSERYFGPFSDDSAKWENYPGFEYVKANDGQWWIDAKSYHEGMSQTTGNPDVQDEHMSYFALFEVEGEHEERITFKSDVDQTVYISAYTYDS